MVHAYALGGSAYALWCADVAACEARQDAEADWAEQRWTITDAGRAALVVIEQAEQLRLKAAS
jgi:hypothetical protein